MVWMYPKCFRCKHFNRKKEIRDCIAFPNGIPIEIYHNEFDHSKPYEGDNGIQFEPKEEKKWMKRIPLYAFPAKRKSFSKIWFLKTEWNYI